MCYIVVKLIASQLEGGMDNSRGAFIAIEGANDDLNTAQLKLVSQSLQEAGYEVVVFDFPRLNQPSGHFVKKYLDGEYGDSKEVGPYTASLFYALDRYEAGSEVRQAVEQGKIVLATRFTGHTMAHQGSQFEHAEQRRGYFIWLDHTEFEMFKTPRPNLSLVLAAPANSGQSTAAQPDTDVSPEDAMHTFDDLCQLFPNDFHHIDCMRDQQLMESDVIAEIVRRKIEPLLPPVKDNSVSAINTNEGTDAMDSEPDNRFIIKNDKDVKPSEEGKAYLQEIVTSSDDNVYAFTNKLNPVTVAAAMARLCRRPGDMRLAILEEFAAGLNKDEKLLQRIITAYGDDSVQQLIGQHLVVEGASNLLTKRLEWGRLAAYLEQSTRYIYYDQKDKQGNYGYYVPDSLSTPVRKQYQTRMNQILDLYAEIVHKLTDHIAASSSTLQKERDTAWKSAVRAQACDAARPALPVAAKSTVGIFASGQALENLITHLMSDELPEARQTGKKLLAEARKVIPAFLERADKPDRGGATIAYRSNTYQAVKEFAGKHLPTRHTGTDEIKSVHLADVWPRNELDLVADMLYEHSNLPLAQLRKEIATWPYDRKLEVFQAYMGERLNRRHKPGRALEKAHYSWDLVCDYGIFRDLQRHRMVDDLQWQELTPRYGYDVPKLIEEAGLSDQFVECFDLSLKLHSLLQEMGHGVEAQYATLLGHKMRWKVTYNAREAFHLHELRTSPQGHPGYRKLVNQMHEKLCEIHPLLGQAMRFVNQDEDPELTRLAAERYTQFKLQQLDTPEEKA